MSRPGSEGDADLEKGRDSWGGLFLNAGKIKSMMQKSAMKLAIEWQNLYGPSVSFSGAKKRKELCTVSNEQPKASLFPHEKWHNWLLFFKPQVDCFRETY